MKAKKVPVRMCAGCGGRFDKRDLVRVVRTPQGDVQLDLTGKMAGRGAYVCHDPACLQKARNEFGNIDSARAEDWWTVR